MAGGEGDAGVALWRVFPWDPAAPSGAPFSAQYVVPAARQVHGRFDLGTSPVLYLAESPEHAVAEMLRPFTGRMLKANHLRGAGHPLALVSVTIAAALNESVADLTDPRVLLARGIRPDVLASRDRMRTQAISRALHDAGLAGFRWWSALHGDWHAVLLFADRLATDGLRYGGPEVLTADHPAVAAAARALNMR
ncbi:MAG TPA: RES family NAD+ phosphorylase [Longimicrobiaceae bacterium]|nr:RES family NAD+ phosphorylase [Longimicrobiaceae bacterium]